MACDTIIITLSVRKLRVCYHCLTQMVDASYRETGFEVLKEVHLAASLSYWVVFLMTVMTCFLGRQAKLGYRLLAFDLLGYHPCF